MTKFSKTTPAEPTTPPLDAAMDNVLGALSLLRAAAADVLAASTRRDPVFQQLSSAINTAAAARSVFEKARIAAQPAAQADAIRSEDATVSVEAPR